MAAGAATARSGGRLRWPSALTVAICADVLRPSLTGCRRGGDRAGRPGPQHGRSPRPRGVRPAAAAVRRATRTARRGRGRQTLHRAAVDPRRQGRPARRHHRRRCPGTARRRARRPRQPDGQRHARSTGSLRESGILGAQAPADRLRELRTAGQRTPEELIDRYRLACRPVRDLLVDYLRERHPRSTTPAWKRWPTYLGKRFWADLERHHPGHRQPAPARRGRRRLEAAAAHHDQDDHDRDRARRRRHRGPRISYRECLTPVRAFYLDLAHWAVEDPARWGRGSRPARSARKRSTGARPSGTASPAWTPAPANGCPSCRRWCAAVDQRRRDTADLLARRPPDPARRAVHRRRHRP